MSEDLSSLFPNVAHDGEIRGLYRRAIQLAQGGKTDNALKQARYYVMHQLARDAIRWLPGRAFVEFGCWNGHSTLILASLMADAGKGGAPLHVFDSFEGWGEMSPKDASKHRKPEDSDPAKYATSAAAFAEKMKGFDFVRIHQGWIPASLEGVGVGPVCFASIDVNLYQATLDSLRYIYPKMAPGGKIYFDDYGYKTCPGATAAIDEFMAECERPRMFIQTPFGSAFLVR